MRARFFYDWGSGTWLWCADDPTREVYGYPIDHHRLPLSCATITNLDRLAERHDEALDWASPLDPGPWREPECIVFNHAVHAALDVVRRELGTSWEILDEFRELHEHPDVR